MAHDWRQSLCDKQASALQTFSFRMCVLKLSLLRLLPGEELGLSGLVSFITDKGGGGGEERRLLS